MKIRYGSSPSSLGSIATPQIRKGRVILPGSPKIEDRLPPVHFFSSADVASGSEVNLRSEALSNRTGRPVEIHEIKVGAILTSETTSSYSVDPGGFLRLWLAVNGKKITNGFVPFWLLGKTEIYGEQSISTAASSTQIMCYYTWRLARPWQIPSDSVVEAAIAHSGGVPLSMRAMVGLAGRYINVADPISRVPYVASYVSKGFDYSAADGSGQATDVSGEKDLVNASGRALNVTRLMARAAVLRGSTSLAISYFQDADNVDAAQSMNIRMQTSRNMPIIRDYSNIRALFGAARAIDVGFQMPQNEYLVARVRKTDGPVLTTPFTSYVAAAHVSILGWREESR